MTKKLKKYNKNKNKNTNKNNIKITINNSSNKISKSRSQPTVIYNNIPASNGGNHEVMHALNTFKSDLDELKRVKTNHFKSANIPRPNILSDATTRPILRSVHQAPIHVKPIQTELTNGRHSEHIIPEHRNLITQRASHTVFPIHDYHLKHSSSSSDSDSTTTSSSTLNIPSDGYFISKPRESVRPKIPEYILPAGLPREFVSRQFTQRDTTYRLKNVNSDSDSDVPTGLRPFNLKIDHQIVDGVVTVNRGARTSQFMRHRFITEVGESFSNVIKPTPPDPSQRPTNTNLFTVLNSEQQPEPTQLPTDNDVEEM